jgi:hypothetical protein
MEFVEASAGPLLEFAPDAVEAIHVQFGELTLQTKRDEGGWLGVSRPQRIEDFLVSLREMVAIMALEDSADDLTDFGLEPPKGKIELQLREGPPISLSLGDPNPAGTANYARVGSDGPVVLTGALLRWELVKKPPRHSKSG